VKFKYCNHCKKRFKLPPEGESNDHWQIHGKKYYTCKVRMSEYQKKLMQQPGYYRKLYDEHLTKHYNTIPGFLKKRYDTMMVRVKYPNVWGHKQYKDLEYMSKEEFVEWGKRTLPTFMKNNDLDHPFNNKVYLIRKKRGTGFIKGNITWFSVNGIRSVAEKTVGRPVQQFSQRGKLISEYNSMTRGAEETEVGFWEVASCCVGIRKQDSKQNIWKFKSDPNFPKYIGKLDRRVIQKDLDGKVIHTCNPIECVAKNEVLCPPVYTDNRSERIC